LVYSHPYEPVTRPFIRVIEMGLEFGYDLLLEVLVGGQDKGVVYDDEHDHPLASIFEDEEARVGA
jgi:hypothetical protein